MSKPITSEVLPENLLEHRAVKAWSQLEPERVKPEAIEILKLKNKSAVYRLAGVGPGGSAVIAKRCRTPTARIERMIHEEFVPRLSVPALRCYGFVEEPGGDYCWLFLEEATGQAYSPLDPEHRALAGQWLGTIHAAAIESGLESRLPARQPSHYLNLLRTSSEDLVRHLANPALRGNDIEVLRVMASYCGVLEAHWSELEEICDLMPRTLVHGDFVIKNVRLRSTAGRLVLLVFDWEYTGWGVPAADLAQFTGYTVSPDLQTYRAAIEKSGAMLDGLDSNRIATCGKFFRLIDDVFWASSCLVFKSYEFLEKNISYLRLYEPRMAEALRAAGWKE